MSISAGISKVRFMLEFSPVFSTIRPGLRAPFLPYMNMVGRYEELFNLHLHRPDFVVHETIKKKISGSATGAITTATIRIHVNHPSILCSPISAITTAMTMIHDKVPYLFCNLFCRTAASSPISRQRASMSSSRLCSCSDNLTTSPVLHVGPASLTTIASDTGMRNMRFEPRSVSVIKCLVSITSKLPQVAPVSVSLDSGFGNANSIFSPQCGQ